EEVLIVLAHRPDLGEQAALGRLRIDVVEMRKVGRIFQLAEAGHAVTLGVFGTGRLRRLYSYRQRREGAGAQYECMTACDSRAAIRSLVMRAKAGIHDLQRSSYARRGWPGQARP